MRRNAERRRSYPTKGDVSTKCTIEYKVLSATLEQLDYACYSWSEFEQRHYRHPNEKAHYDDEYVTNVIYKVTVYKDGGPVMTRTKLCTVNKFYQSVKRTIKRLVIQFVMPYFD